MRRQEQFYLDIDKSSMATRFTLKQLEDAEILISLQRDERPFFVEDYDISIYIESKFGEAEQIEVLKVDGNDIRALIPGASLEHLGIFCGEIEISSTDGLMRTPTFYFVVNKSIGGGNSQVVYDLLDSEGYSLLDSDGYELQVRR